MRKLSWIALATLLALSVGAAWGGTPNGSSRKTNADAGCCCCSDTCEK